MGPRFARTLILLTLATAFGVAAAVPARADEFYSFVVKKQEEKDRYRWYMDDWFDTQDKIRIMDLWLALHSPSPYEFVFTSEYRFTNGEATPPFNTVNLGVAGYASIVGLEADEAFSSKMPETTLLLGLRVFGFSQQGTHINLVGGFVNTDLPDGATRSGALGVRLAVDILRNFGIEGGLLHLFPSSPNSAGLDKTGTRVNAGAFIDFSCLRLYGEYFESSEPSYPSGFGAGIKFFF